MWISELLRVNRVKAALKGAGKGLHSGLSCFIFHLAWKHTEPIRINRHYVHDRPVHDQPLIPQTKTFLRGWMGCDWECVTRISLRSDSYLCGIYRRRTDRGYSLHLWSLQSHRTPSTSIFYLTESGSWSGSFICVFSVCFLTYWSILTDRTEPASWDEPGECDRSLRVGEPLGAAVRPPRSPGAGGAL